MHENFAHKCLFCLCLKQGRAKNGRFCAKRCGYVLKSEQKHFFCAKMLKKAERYVIMYYELLYNLYARAYRDAMDKTDSVRFFKQ